VNIDEDSLTVDLYDGRSLSVPLAWYPRLDHATRLSNGTGVGLEIEKGFIGRIWTKTSAFKT
jgi:signal transduction histidine kinase